jgi:hypothetical protein
MSRSDKATEATLRMLNLTRPSEQIEPSFNVEQMPTPAPGKAPKVIATSSARTMVYLPLAWKEKFREIAYHERRKENDLSLEAFRDFLAKKGHKVD